MVGEATVVTAWRKPPTRISRELILPIEGVHQDARETRSDTKIKLLAGIARRATGSTSLSLGGFSTSRIAQREKRSFRSTAMLLSLAFLAPSLVQAIADNRLPRGIGLTRLADLPGHWSQQFKMLDLQALR
jgi:hypothetical protein